MKQKKIFIVIFLVFLVTGIFATKEILKNPFEYAGTIEATRVDLPSRVATVVKSIKVNEGQQVKKGDILAELACEELELNNNLIQENYQRARQLRKTGSISKESFDQIQNKKEESDTRLGWCHILAPVDGTILTRFLEPSEWVNPGSKIVTLADLKHLWTYFYVSQETMSQLQLGTLIEGSVPELNKKFDGIIEKINDEAEFTPKNVQTQAERTRLVFGIKVSFKNDEGLLKPGMTILSNLNKK